jgi:hypothetical protein
MVLLRGGQHDRIHDSEKGTAASELAAECDLRSIRRRRRIQIGQNAPGDQQRLGNRTGLRETVASLAGAVRGAKVLLVVTATLVVRTTVVRASAGAATKRLLAATTAAPRTPAANFVVMTSLPKNS